jgi:hypothetical protein
VNSTRNRRPVNTIQRSFSASTHRLITDNGAPPTLAAGHLGGEEQAINGHTSTLIAQMFE